MAKEGNALQPLAPPKTLKGLGGDEKGEEKSQYSLGSIYNHDGVTGSWFLAGGGKKEGKGLLCEKNQSSADRRQRIRRPPWEFF